MAENLDDRTPRPIAPGLFFDDETTPASARLRGARHRDTGRILFPYPDSEDGAFEPLPLAREGALWSFTIQRFRPKSPPYAGPEAFTPYAVGYVELPGQLIVESRLTGIPFDALRIGMALRLTIEPIVNPAGIERLTFAFTSVETNDD